MRFIGRREAPMPAELVERMEWAEELTAGNDRITLFVAFNYGGRAEIVDAARTLHRRRPRRSSASHLYAPEMHDPDLIIRTSGEQRLSNYLLWQSAYSELVFRDELWPDFDRAAFEAALEEYAARQRRFGARVSARGSGARPRAGAAEPARAGRAATRRSDLGARVLVAIPARSRSRSSSSRAAGWSSRSG